MKTLTLVIVGCLIALSGPIQAADIVLNEYNAVASTAGFLGGGNSDSRLGIRAGNGGDWLELAVITDHLDIRDWQVIISHRTGEPSIPGPGEQIFELTFSQDQVWEDLRSGTIITISEKIPQNVGDYAPVVGKWWLNVRASATSGGRYVTASDFAVSNDKTQITIKNHLGENVFGPAGEGISPAAGVGSDEVFKLEETPFAGTIPNSTAYSAGTSSSYGMANMWTDAGGALVQDYSLLRSMVPYFPLSSVVINEINSHSDPPEEDWIELYNRSDSEIDIGGWFLSDGSVNLMQYQIPAGMMIPAGGYAVFTESVLPFSLNGQVGEFVFLSKGNGLGGMTGDRDYVEFGPLENGVSFGRSPDGVGAFYRMAQRTQAAENSAPAVGPLVISEVMYHAAGPPPIGLSAGELEYIELQNLKGVPTPLEVDYGASGVFGWQIGGGVQYPFTNGASVAADSYLLLVSFDPTAEPSKLESFRGVYAIPGEIPIHGPYAGKLNNYSDSVELLRPDSPALGVTPMVSRDSITYLDWDSWPTSADGGGPSLERIDPRDAGTDSTHWAASQMAGGTPGRINSVTTPVPEPPVLRAILAGLLLLMYLARTGKRNASR